MAAYIELEPNEIRQKAVAIYTYLTNLYQTVPPDLLQKLMSSLGYSADDIELV